MKNKNISLLLYAIIALVGLYILENILHPTYGYLLLAKVTLFLILPLGWRYVYQGEGGRFGIWTRNILGFGVAFGIFAMMGIGIAYFFLEKEINWSAIRASMEARHINEATFLLVFAYIMLGNSLLEEYFFRGILFEHSRGYSKFWAYIFSSVLFAFYHMVIFQAWFTGWILALALLGLFLGGIFFAWLYEKTGGVWSAWIVHIFADLAILIIGYVEFFLS